MSAALLLFAQAVAAEALPPICTDRPAKANAVCTVPPGRIQLEVGGYGWTLLEADGSRTEQQSFGASVIKIGVDGRSDVQIAVTPHVTFTTRDRGGVQRQSGFGDTVVRYKRRVSAGGSPVQVSLIPFMKLPTAPRGLGNRKVEGGLAVPVSFTLVGPATLTFGPELDMLADADERGHHPAVVGLVNVSLPLAKRLTVAAELWVNANLEPASNVYQSSVDAAVAYLVTDQLQLDAGVNAGLTRATSDIETYLGLSLRF